MWHFSLNVIPQNHAWLENTWQMITNVKNVRREPGAKKELIPVIAVQMGKCLMLAHHLKTIAIMVSIFEFIFLVWLLELGYQPITGGEKIFHAMPRKGNLFYHGKFTGVFAVTFYKRIYLLPSPDEEFLCTYTVFMECNSCFPPVSWFNLRAARPKGCFNSRAV